MARKKQAAAAAEVAAEKPKRVLTRDQRLRRVFSGQARAAAAMADFSDEELDGFAELMGEDGATVPDIRERFAALWLAHRERVKATPPPADAAE